MKVENYRPSPPPSPSPSPSRSDGWWGMRSGPWGLPATPTAMSKETSSFRSGGLLPGDTIYRVMVAWLTWRRIPVPEWSRPVVEQAQQPAIPPPQSGAYGNAALAQASQASRPRHITGPNQAPQANRVNLIPAHSLGETGTPVPQLV